MPGSKREFDLTGQTFGRLVALRPTGKAGKWVCKCICGKITEVRSSGLRRHTTKSCGCLQRDNGIAAGKGRIVDDGWASHITTILNNISRGKIQRSVELTYTQIKSIIQKDCFYCGAAPSIDSNNNIVKRNGIDRVDNALGYVIENCVPCCPKCNFMKRGYTAQEFVEHAQKISEYSADISQFRRKA